MVRYRIRIGGTTYIRQADGSNVGTMGKRRIKDDFLDFSLRNWPNNGSVHQDGNEWGSKITGATEVKNSFVGTSLVAQWLRIPLPRQGTRVQALVQEDPTRRRTTKPVCHNY